MTAVGPPDWPMTALPETRSATERPSSLRWPGECPTAQVLATVAGFRPTTVPALALILCHEPLVWSEPAWHQYKGDLRCHRGWIASGPPGRSCHTRRGRTLTPPCTYGPRWSARSALCRLLG